MEIIHTQNAPGAIGPYVQAVASGEHIFVSGQTPIRPESGEIPVGIAAQTEQSCKNVEAILQEAGSSMEKVIKTTCFLNDMTDFTEFNVVYARYFVSHPARSCVAVRALPKGVLCEIEAIAEK